MYFTVSVWFMINYNLYPWHLCYHRFFVSQVVPGLLSLDNQTSAVLKRKFISSHEGFNLTLLVLYFVTKTKLEVQQNMTKERCIDISYFRQLIQEMENSEEERKMTVKPWKVTPLKEWITGLRRDLNLRN